jgi:hypothetical protein
MAPDCALILDVPAAMQFTACVVPRVPSVATPAALVVQVAVAVRFLVEPSEYVPVAVKLTAEPTN